MGRHHKRQVPLIAIASPLAGHRLTKKIGELITKSADQKQLIYGVKDTGKALKKSENGICVLGGNVTPMDVITHLPAMCESKNVPYVFLPTREQISAYAQRTSPVACVVIREPEQGSDLAAEFQQLKEEISQLDASPQGAEEAE